MVFRRIISITVFCIYIAAVAYLCFAKPDDVPQLPDIWLGLPADKVAHFLMFLPFPFLGYLVFVTERLNTWKNLLLIAALIVVGLAAAIATEQVQALLAYRSAETEDMGADGVGLLCGGVLTVIYTLIRRRK